MKLEHSLTPYLKINSKWIEDLNIRLPRIKLLEENISRTHFDIVVYMKNIPPKTETISGKGKGGVE